MAVDPTNPDHADWTASHRLLIAASPNRSIQSFCVMLDERGDAWTRHDWHARHPPTARLIRGRHWVMNRHVLGLVGPIRLLDVIRLAS